MMNLYRPNNRYRRTLVVATGILAAIFFFDIVSGGAIRAIVRTGASHLWVSGSSVSSPIKATGIFASRRALEAQIQSLKEQLLLLQARAGDVSALQKENDSLRALVHLASAAQGITAPIISSVSASPYGTFMIGAGSADHVAAGDIVVTASGATAYAVGRVGNVSTHTALVTELFAAGATSEAVVHGVGVVLNGVGGGNAHADAPRGSGIVAGDVVVSPLFGGRPIAVVGAIEETPTSPSRKIYVALPVNLNSTQFVYVISHEK